MTDSVDGAPGPTWDLCIDHLYESVGHEPALASALGQFMPFFDARAVTYFTWADTPPAAASPRGPAGAGASLLAAYHDHFSAHDEWLQAALRRRDVGAGSVFRGAELVDPARLRRSYFWKEFLAPFGIVDSLSVVAEHGTGAGPTSFLSYYRHAGQRPFGTRHARLLARLGPHLRHALRLHRRLAPTLALGATVREIVQGVDVPLLFVGDDRRIVERNAAARAALADPQGWLAEGADGLRISTAKGWRSIAAALESLHGPAAEPVGPVVMDLVSPLRRCATLTVRRVGAAAGDHIARHAAVAVCTLQRGARDRFRVLRELHGLTAAEARVALQVAEGRRAADIVHASGLRLTTVRSHIASALGKLGLQRQSQLVSYVMAM